MKISTACSLAAVGFGLFIVGPAVNAGAPTAPQILNVRASGTNLLVSVRVPKGARMMMLESRAREDAGAWVPRAVTRSGLGTGKVVFRVPAAIKGEIMRARAASSEALPRGFYLGKHAFPKKRSTFWRPDQGRGEVFSLSASGNLPATLDLPSAATTTRTVSESDIWRVSGNTLYFFNQLRGLQVIDISNPDAPVLRSTWCMPAVGEQMYVLDSEHVVLLVSDSCNGDGTSRAVVVEVSGANSEVVATLPVDGWIVESRLVGSALYIVSQQYAGVMPARSGTASGSEWGLGTLVSSFDLSNPAAPVARSSLTLNGQPAAILATDTYLFVAGGAYSDSAAAVHAVDISSPDGTLGQACSIPVAGAISDKFKMNFSGAVFTAVSEHFDMGTVTDPWVGQWITTVETFSLADLANPVKLGSLDLAPGERLFATRFDGTRVYAVTFERIDPLWVLDLADPAHPVVAGSVDVPGWSTYIHPAGDRLITIGMEGSRVAVSLFDVGDAAHPALLSRVLLGEQYSWSEANYDEKAFRFFADAGLILVPYQGAIDNGYAARVQLIELGRNTLALRGVIDHKLQPRRAELAGSRVLSISARELLSVDISDRDDPRVTSDLDLAWPVNRLFLQGEFLLELSSGDGWTGESSAVLRIANKVQPEITLSKLDLGTWSVVGAASRENLLFLLQSPNSWYGRPLVLTPAMSGTQRWEPSTNLLMTIVDLSASPAVKVLSQTQITGDLMAGSFEALWPAPNLLVWLSTGPGAWINPIMDAPGIISAGPVVAGSGTMAAPGSTTSLLPTQSRSGAMATSSRGFLVCPFWRPWWGGGGAQLVSLDVSDPEAPRALASLDLNPTNSWGFSKGFAANSLVYLTHEQFELSAMAVSDSSSRMTEWLDVVDFSDPTTPTVRPAVSVPGTLTGVSQDGAMLYLLGTASTLTGLSLSTSETLSACSYDGVNAYLVNSLALPQTWPRPVLVSGDRVLLGRTGAAESAGGTLELWALSAGGKFQRRAVAQLTQPASAIASFGGTVAVQIGGSKLVAFDVSSGSTLSLVGQGGTPGCLWSDLNRAVANASGLWMALDDYGVAVIPLSPP